MRLLQSLGTTRVWWSVTILLLAIFFVLGAASIRHKSPTYDEKQHLSYGRQILEEGTFIRRIGRHNSKVPVSALNALPEHVARKRALRLPRSQLLYLNRLPTLVMGVVLGLLVALWAREAFGPRAGTAALVLYTFSPNILAHARLITTDLATSLGTFAATYAFWRFGVRATMGRGLIAGLALGLALVTKASSLLIIPTLLLLTLAGPLTRARSRSEGEVSEGRLPRVPLAELRSLTKPLLWILVIALLVINSVYLFEGGLTPLRDYAFKSLPFKRLAGIPLLRDLPVPLPYGYLQGIDMVSNTMDRDRWTYCMGEFRPRGFPYYFLVGFATKTTVGFLALLLLTLFLRLVVDRARVRNVELFLLVPSAFFFIYLSFFFHFHIGFRHILPVLPLLFVFISQLAERPRKGAALQIATLILVLLHAASSLSVYPHYLAYFNEPSGGPLNGWRYLIDSNLDWGQDRAYARWVYAPRSPVPIIQNPGGPVAGRIMVNVNSLVGLKPGGARRYAWLRENFRPVDHVGYSFLIYDVSPGALEECCLDDSGRRPAGPKEEKWVAAGPRQRC